MKRSIQKREAAESRVLAFPVGAVIGACISPLAWWAFQVPLWKPGLLVTLGFALVFGLVAAIARPKKIEQFVALVVKLLNP